MDQQLETTPDAPEKPAGSSQKARRQKAPRKSQFTKKNAAIIGAFFFSLAALVLILYLIMVLWIPACFPAPEQAQNEFPFFTYTSQEGTVTGEPVNLVLLADEGQKIVDAFEKAGMIQVESVDQQSLALVLGGAVEKRITPISKRYVMGKEQDYGFQSPSDSLAHRHHLRVWRYGDHTLDGKPVWLVAASYDHGLGLSLSGFLPVPTHIVSPNIDDERDFIADLLDHHKLISHRSHAPGVGPFLFRSNGDFSFYFTDGAVLVLTLEEPPDGKTESQPWHWSLEVRNKYFDAPTIVLQFLRLAHAYKAPFSALEVIEEGL